jgi:hypothetical protein
MTARRAAGVIARSVPAVMHGRLPGGSVSRYCSLCALLYHPGGNGLGSGSSGLTFGARSFVRATLVMLVHPAGQRQTARVSRCARSMLLAAALGDADCGSRASRY